MDPASCTLTNAQHELGTTRVADRVIDLALRTRAAHAAAREFLRRYAIDQAAANATRAASASREFPRFHDRRPSTAAFHR